MKALENNIINLYSDQGKQWLLDLPQLVIKLQQNYGLTNLKPIRNLSYNYVLAGLQGEQPIILKLGLDIDGFKCEAAALKVFAGFGIVQVLAEDNGMLLLKRAISGISLKAYFPAQDDEAINITATTIKRLHQAPLPSTHSFPHIQDWLTALDKGCDIPAVYLQKAKRLSDYLLQTSTKQVLLHGDLHHDNILQHHEAWVAIDPKGVVGESAYEVAAFIRNPIPELLAHNNAQSIINHRVARFAERLELPAQRIVDWCFVQAVLAWAWSLEDNCFNPYFQQLVEFFESCIDDESSKNFY